MLFRIYLIIVFVSLYQFSFSQNILKGTVYKEGIDSIGAYVTVTNVSQGIVNLSTANGSYKIKVNEKDMIVFSYVGFSPDTIIVEKQLLTDGYDAFLLSNEGVVLEQVTVRGDYKKILLKEESTMKTYITPRLRSQAGMAPKMVLEWHSVLSVIFQKVAKKLEN